VGLRGRIVKCMLICVFGTLLITLLLLVPLELQAAAGFNSALPMRVYERGAEDRIDRLIGTTPLPAKQALRLPAQGVWYVEPLDPITPATLKRLLREIDRLKIPGLDLSGHSEVDDAMLLALTRASKLKILLLARTSVTNKGLAHLKAFSHLQVLSLGDGVTAAGLPALAPLQGLEDLDLSDTRIAATGLRQFRALPRLRRLNLPENRWTEAGLTPLLQSRNLRFIVVAGDFTQEAMAVLGQSRDLRGIDLQRTRFPAGALRGLKSLAHLETLYLPPQLDKSDLAALAALPKLKTLDVTGAVLTAAHLKQLGKIKTLQALALTDSPVQSADLLALKSLKRLTLLELSGTRVASGELKPLQAFTQLEVLGLPQSEMPSQDRIVLSKLSKLRVLALAGQPVSAELYGELRAIAQKPLPPSPERFATPTLASIPQAPLQTSAQKTASETLWTDKTRRGIRLGEPLDKPVAKTAPDVLATNASPVMKPTLRVAPTPQKPAVTNVQLAGLTGIQRLRALSANQVAISDIIPADSAQIRSFEETSENSLGEFNFNAK